MTWDPGFLGRSKMLEPIALHAASLAACTDWPRREALQSLVSARGIVNARGVPLRLVPPERLPGVSFETRVYERGELEVRECAWHDLFNVLAWTAYPRTKAALNARHVDAAAREHDKNAARRGNAGANRGRVRDALTAFDESGAIFVSSDGDLIEDLQAFRWKSLFWTKRPRALRNLRVYLFGHAMLEKALSPYVGMTAHAITLHVDESFAGEPLGRQVERVDALAARHVVRPASLLTPQELAPLPVLGVPGWWMQNGEERFYDDIGYFRPGRMRKT